MEAIEKDQLPWVNLSDLKGGKNEACVLYAVTSIPFNFLIDPEGKIIEKNLRGDALPAALEKYIK